MPEAPHVPGRALNDPPMIPGAGGLPPLPPGAPGMPGGPPTTDQVAQAIGSVASEAPKMDPVPETVIELPAGWMSPSGVLVQKATVRELNGYDEEKLSRIDMGKNFALFVTELVTMGTSDLGGEPPTKDIIRDLLIGDRDALIIGIRQATYGNEVEFKIHCEACGKDSAVGVELDSDIPTVVMDDPTVREFDVTLRHGHAKVALLNGRTQEAFAENLLKKTQAEINTVVLAHCVISINDVPVMGREEDVKRLSAADRATLTDFMAEYQPGPKLSEPVNVNCATCGEEYPITLGLPTMFRF